MQRRQQGDEVAAVGVVHVADQRRTRALGAGQQFLHSLDIAVFTAGAQLPGKGDDQRAVEKADRPAVKRPPRTALHELTQLGALENEARLVHAPVGEDAVAARVGQIVRGQHIVRGHHLEGDILFIAAAGVAIRSPLRSLKNQPICTAPTGGA